MPGIGAHLDDTSTIVSSAFGGDVGGYLAAIVVVLCVLSLLPVGVGVWSRHVALRRIATLNALGPAVALAAWIVAASAPSLQIPGLAAFCLAIWIGLTLMVATAVDVLDDLVLRRALVSARAWRRPEASQP